MIGPSILTKRKESKLSKFIRRLHIIWVMAWWTAGFFVLLPFFCLCIWFRKIEHWMSFFNELWCYLFFGMGFIRVKTNGKSGIPKNQPVVYCCNHGSFLDIPLLTYILPGFPAFMGKASLGKIPVFGFMFRNLHIVVDRGSSQGRAKALKMSRKLLARGRSIIIFPEGSIHSKIQPGISEFKDGAFKLAIQKQVPLVPMTVCFNWYILPDDGRWLPNFYYCKTIIHEPISTIGLTEADCEMLKNQVFTLISETLAEQNKSLVQSLSK